jgi:hypothetical protein
VYYVEGGREEWMLSQILEIPLYIADKAEQIVLAYEDFPRLLG